ncbi:hypothetical protein BJ986_000936 [Phycicoccus badiiscoriae]|uniref:Uncharacterized protein n=1 Tax=Pedococcus badiiscoriae TaxID=642776 RepID=A0A852WCC5_9MICO|nr:hypothetical protein [Pedococcus badiiscoriae]NYG06449.1 hypothetical protein [Pedococcus badiiscoriae]
MVGDPDEIRALAVRLRAEAEQVRRLAWRVALAREVTWRSPAATLFRERAQERAHALQHAARRLDEASRRVQAHADAVEAARVELLRGAALAADLARATSTPVSRPVGSW